jgi:hypothetical protein
MKKELQKAYKLYEDFRESTPKRLHKVIFRKPKSLMAMGHLRSVSYDTTRGGKTELYKHTFAPGSRPILCASEDGWLFLVGGRYEVTERGIVDLDGQDREIE